MSGWKEGGDKIRADSVPKERMAFTSLYRGEVLLDGKNKKNRSAWKD